MPLAPKTDKQRKRLLPLAPVLVANALLLVFGLRLAIRWYEALGLSLGLSILCAAVSVAVIVWTTTDLYGRLLSARCPHL